MVGFALLGCGRIGRMHAGNLARHPAAESLRTGRSIRVAARSTSIADRNIPIG